jgi:hypothetical protein
MSIRPQPEPFTEPAAAPLLLAINEQRQAELAASAEEEQSNNIINAIGHLDGLNETERSAANLGVSAEEWKPIGFLNKGHYGNLLKSNALAGNLAQKLEAYKEVAQG